MNTINLPGLGNGEIRLALPYPVSVNKVWGYGKGRVFRSPEYKAWLAEANVAWLQQKNRLIVKKVSGPYMLLLEAIAPDNRHRDVGNLEKGVSDFLQMIGVVSNDRLAEWIILHWLPATKDRVGVIATVYPLDNGTRQATSLKA